MTTHSSHESSATVLTQADIKKCLDLIDAIGEVLQEHLVSLTPAARRAATKSSKESDRVVPLLAGLASRFGLSGSTIDVDAMQQKQQVANLLLPLLGRVSTLRTMVADTVLDSHGSAWRTAGTVYTVLRRLEKSNSSLAQELSAVKSAFTKKRKSSEPPTIDAPKEEAPPAQPVPTAKA